MTNTYQGAARFKDGVKRTYEIGNVQGYQEACQALIDEGALSAVVLVPKPVEEFVYEPQTA